MSVESKAFAEALAKVGGSYHRVYSSRGLKGRRVKLYGVHDVYFPLLEKVARRLGAFKADRLRADNPFGLVSFVAWFPLEVTTPATEGCSVPVVRAKPFRVEILNAQTVRKLSAILWMLNTKYPGATWRNGFKGLISVFDVNGRLVAEIRK
jgi:hypothetical protein